MQQFFNLTLPGLHRKGINQRDIKPSNILVTLRDGVPVLKVIDFGIAKATQQELTDKTVFTQFQQFIGTPAYISPQQAEMRGLDIESLGILACAGQRGVVAGVCSGRPAALRGQQERHHCCARRGHRGAIEHHHGLRESYRRPGRFAGRPAARHLP